LEKLGVERTEIGGKMKKLNPRYHKKEKECCLVLAKSRGHLSPDERRGGRKGVGDLLKAKGNTFVDGPVTFSEECGLAVPD